MIQHYENSETRVLQLENIEAIRRLKCEFAERLDRLVNEGGPEQPVLDCFCETAIWKSEHFGSYTGREGLTALLGTYREKLSFSLNFMLNHVITVNEAGTAATGRWTTWTPMTFEGQALVLAGHYSDTYSLIETEWKIASVHLQAKFIADYKKGWAQDRITKSWNWKASTAGEISDVA